jgi:transcriptional regulator with XRE-family HTH domain
LSQERLGVYGWHRDEMSASARMNQYERGKHVPDISIVEKFAEVLNLPSAFFYATDDDFTSRSTGGAMPKNISDYIAWLILGAAVFAVCSAMLLMFSWILGGVNYLDRPR